jgi:hypothetical protein
MQRFLGYFNRGLSIHSAVVDDQELEVNFDLVMFMNREYHRGRFLENGVFSFKRNLGISWPVINADRW